jgi:hypothetical protein
MIDAWRFAYCTLHLLVDRIDWETMGHEALRRVVVAIVGAVDDKMLAELARVAEDDCETFFQCTIGHDIGEALEKIGLNPAHAESIAQDAIRAALNKAQEAQVVP